MDFLFTVLAVFWAVHLVCALLPWSVPPTLLGLVMGGFAVAATTVPEMWLRGAAVAGLLLLLDQVVASAGPAAVSRRPGARGLPRI